MKRSKWGNLPLQLTITSIAVGAMSLSASAASLIIDDFAVAQGPLAVSPLLGPQTDSSSASGAGIVGGGRDLILSTQSGSSPFASAAQVAGGVAQLADNTQFTSDLMFQWDGADNDPNTLDVAGLGGLDLTQDGIDAFEIGLIFDDLPATLSMTVYSTNGNSSSTTFPGTGLIFTDLSIYIPYALFNGNADFTDVGAIEFAVSSPLNGLDISFDFIQTAAAPVPIPGALWLLVSAVFGFTVSRR